MLKCAGMAEMVKEDILVKRGPKHVRLLPNHRQHIEQLSNMPLIIIIFIPLITNLQRDHSYNGPKNLQIPFEPLHP